MQTETVATEPIDVDDLLRVARDKSAASRQQLVETISDLFFGDRGMLSERERAIMADILRQLIHDVEVSVRKHLAIRLADQPDAPYDLIVSLANDDAEVAHSILLKSDVLRDGELVEVIRHRTLEHQLPIAMRTDISEIVSDALVETGESSVITTLLENPNAHIATGTMEYLVEQSRRVDGSQNPLLHRHDLPSELARRMYWWVSAALRTHIVKRFDVDPSELDEMLETAVDEVLIGGAEDKSVHSAADKLAEQLVNTQDSESEFLIDLLRQGEVSLFEAMFSKLTELRIVLTRRLIYEPGGEGLAIACRAAGIEKETFATIFVLSRQARPGGRVVAKGEVAQVMGFYDRIDDLAAQRILRRWRRNPDYLDLLRQVEAITAMAG